MSTEAERTEAYIMAHSIALKSPIFYGPNILAAARAAGLDVDGLMKGGFIAETGKIPTKGIALKTAWLPRGR